LGSINKSVGQKKTEETKTLRETEAGVRGDQGEK